MCNCRFRCCCCPCCCCRPRRPGGPGGIGPGGPGGPGGVGPGNDICAGVRRRAYREGFLRPLAVGPEAPGQGIPEMETGAAVTTDAICTCR